MVSRWSFYDCRGYQHRRAYNLRRISADMTFLMLLTQLLLLLSAGLSYGSQLAPALIVLTVYAVTMLIIARDRAVW